MNCTHIITAEVTKYRNKARFFEDQIVEKEAEAAEWKAKYQQDLDEHTRSQDALIHGFNAEISNLKSQIFHFKTQLYSVKSPTKSPGGTIKSPNAKMKLFPMSPLNTSAREESLNTSFACSSPKEAKKHDVSEQIKCLQNELDQNCSMIKDLEHALQVSRAASSDLERRLEKEMAKNRDIQKDRDCTKVCEENSVESKHTGNEKIKIIETVVNDSLLQKEAEISQLKDKVSELQPLMKDYFSMSKKLTESEKKVKELNEKLEDKINQIINYETKLNKLETELSSLNKTTKDLQEKNDKMEEQAEVMETLNNELKGMVDKTATELQTKETEIQILSPKLERLQKEALNENKLTELTANLRTETKEIEDLRMKLAKMTSNCQVKDIACKEATEKCFEFEFYSNEKEIENQDLKKQLHEQNKKLVELGCQKNDETHELQKTGEELAVASVEIEKLKRIIEEQKASISDLESALANKDLELIEQDKQLDDRGKEITLLKKDIGALKKNEVIGNNTASKSKEIENKLKTELEELKDNLLQKGKYFQEEVIKLKDEIAYKQKELEETKEKSDAHIENVVKELETVKDQLQQLKDTLEDKSREALEQETELTGKLESCELDKQDLEKTVKELEDQLSSLEADLKQKETQCSSLQASLNELKEKSSHEDISVKLIEIADLKASVHTHKSLHHKIKGELQEALLDVENSRSEIEQYKKEISNFKESEKEMSKNFSKMQQIKKELEEKSDEVVCAEKMLAELREVIRRRDEQLEELHNDLRNMNASSENFSKSKMEHTEMIESLKKTVSEKEQKIQSLQEEVSSNLLKTEELSVKISDLQGEVVEARKLKTKLEKSAENLFLKINDIAVVAGCEAISNEDIEDSSVSSLVKNICDVVKSNIQKHEQLSSMSNDIIAFRSENDQLNEQIKTLNEENCELRNKLSENKHVKDSENELRSQLTLKEVECETVNLELKVLKENFSKEKELNEHLQKELKQTRTNDVLISSMEKSDNGCDSTNTEKLKEIERLYEAEKLKNEEYQKLLTDTSEMNCFSPQTGVRKLRKEKIEMQNTLVEAQYKISTLESKVKELQLKNVNNTANDVTAKQDLVQRRLNNVTEKLHETEGRNKSLIIEVTQLQGEVERLEAELRLVEDRLITLVKSWTVIYAA